MAATADATIVLGSLSLVGKFSFPAKNDFREELIKMGYPRFFNSPRRAINANEYWGSLDTK